MKHFYIVIFLFEMIFAQAQTSFRGIIFQEGLPLSKVEIINETQKLQAISDNDGRFSIAVSENDVLFFLHQKCADTKIIVSKVVLNNANFTVNLPLKSIDLDEVEIVNGKKMAVKVSYGDITHVKLAKEEARPKNGIYTGQIQQGADLIEIGRLVGKLFKKSKSEKNVIPVNFKKTIKASFDTMFFLKTMNLKVDDIHLFLDFCDADPQSQAVAQSDNVLTVMDFLFKKRQAFK